MESPSLQSEREIADGSNTLEHGCFLKNLERRTNAPLTAEQRVK